MAGWLLGALVLGIVGAELTRVMVLGWVFLSLGFLILFFKGKQQLGVLALFFAAGVLLTGLRLDGLPSPVYGQSASYTVKTVRVVQEGEGYWAWLADILEPTDLAGATVLVYSEDYKPGLYELRGMLRPPVQYRNPGQGWHYKRKFYGGEIGVLSYPKVISFQKQTLGPLDTARAYYQRNITKNLPEKDCAGLALALTTGNRSLLAGDIKTAVYLTGVGHLLAMSGLHVGIMLGLFMALLRRLGCARNTASLLGFLGVLLFLVFAGPSPSLIRAVLMSAWGIAAALLGREKHGLIALEWTCLIMLLYNPLWLFDYAFVFSVLATFICLTASGRLDSFLTFLPQTIRRIVSLSILIQLTALPLTIYLFGASSLWGPIANLILIPLLPLATVLALATGFLPGLAGGLAALPARLLLGGIVRFLSLLSQLPLSLTMGGVGLAFTTIVCGGLVLYLAGVSLSRTLRLVTVCLLACVCWFNFVASQVTTVWFLDVGQGDSILVRSKGRWLLVDCGDGRAGENAVAPTLRFLGVTKLDALILTHSHEDHTGGAASILASVAVDSIYSSFATDYPQERLVSGRAEIAPGVVVMSHGRALTNVNDMSLLVSVGGDKVLLTGDIESEGERLYMGWLRPHSVLKVAHHGSGTSSAPEFIARIQPQVAVISCGLGNSFGMPRAETIKTLLASGSDVLRTDVAGYVRVDFWPWGAVSISTFGGK